jgi:hypothetical protein
MFFPYTYNKYQRNSLSNCRSGSKLINPTTPIPSFLRRGIINTKKQVLKKTPLLAKEGEGVVNLFNSKIQPTLFYTCIPPCQGKGDGTAIKVASNCTNLHE